MPVNDIVACGGLPDKNKLLMQIYADVTRREFSIAASTQTPALGSAMWAAVAAGAANGGYDSIEDASAAMAQLRDEHYVPDPAAAAVYDELYAEYKTLHDYFGRGANDAMKRLRAIRDRACRPLAPRSASHSARLAHRWRSSTRLQRGAG